MSKSDTQVSLWISASRSVVYRLILDPNANAIWRAPDGMTCTVHRFEPIENGRVHISLTYTNADEKGKTSEHTDSYQGRFVKIVPESLVVEEDQFITEDTTSVGTMTFTLKLRDEGEGTRLDVVHEGLPKSIDPKDNELGWRMALTKLKHLAETLEGKP